MSTTTPRALGALILLLACLGVARAADDFQRERRGGPKDAAKDALEGKAPPALSVDGWVNTDGEPLVLADLKGKVVLIDFWGVWCGPCRASIPHLAKLYEKHKDEGLVVIGVHTTGKGDQMKAYAEKNGIPYPVAVDTANATVGAYHVDGYPDYYLIDRAGNLRVADCANGGVDAAVAKLLAEKAPD